MNPTEDNNKYPVFERNQVLTDASLNQAISYLDEQERLTRADLIGIGIVCGLEIKLNDSKTEIHLSKGCGITSEGYLIVEPKGLELKYCRKLSSNDLLNLDYKLFKEKDLWELFENENEPETKLFKDSDLSLDGMAVLLFLELKKEGLRTCSPDNCDDKGSEITPTVRRFLIKSNDDLISNSMLKCPEAPLPKFPSPEIFCDFNSDKKAALVASLVAAIECAYQALEVLIPDLSNSDVGQLNSLFSSLSKDSVISCQCYSDFLSALVAAYGELRTALHSVRCLPDSAFPRHLVLGLANGKEDTKPCRTVFSPSPAVARGELRFLFERLNQMVKDFIIQAHQLHTNACLNQAIKVLDEQERLARAKLHGIGVVCGLTVSVAKDFNVVTISKGYGVTSEGYLARVDNKDFKADSYKTYMVSEKHDYTLFKGTQLWELLEEGGEPLNKDILASKVVLLFAELQEENLNSYSPSSCYDNDKKVEVIWHKLLIDQTALKALNANTEKAYPQGDFFPNLSARLDLPDLRLPRLPDWNKNKVDAQTIFEAYRTILTNVFVKKVGAALDATYTAFKPMLSPLFSSPPPDKFLSKTLDAIYGQYEAVQKDQNIIYSQYFYDFLDDIIQAYEEFRWKALDFMALCNPPAELFPRHLELGEITGGNFAGHKIHRHYFRPSPALAEQKTLGAEVQLLFQRLQLMLEQFQVPENPVGTKPESVLKIIPSRLGGAPLSEKAIPYYYDLIKNPSLLTSWNFHKTRTGREKQNLGYNVPTEYQGYISASVEPLNYDLENYNFFRIEGHIGLDWRNVLKDLSHKIDLHRLPFDVVALNAHPETVTDNPWKSSCLTNDLQVIYDAWKGDLNCLLKEKIKVITNIQIPAIPLSNADKTLAAELPDMPQPSAKINVLSSMSSSEGSLGRLVANAINKQPATSSISVKLTDSVRELLKENSEARKLSVADYDLIINKPVEVVNALVDFSNSLPVNASDLQYKTVSSSYQKLTKPIADYLKDIKGMPLKPDSVITPEILKTLNELLNNCLIERLEVLVAELKRRNKQIEELIFFNKFVHKHPGLEHKAGVPKGGTFVLVFQELPTEINPAEKGGFIKNKLKDTVKISATGKTAPTNASALTLTADEQKTLKDALEKLKKKGINMAEEIQAILGGINPGDAKAEASTIIPEGVVIADFFLPYRCCSSCPPVQFVLPPPRPIFVLRPECPDGDGNAIVKFEFSYRTPPCEVQIDDKPYVPLTEDKIKLSVGKHKVVVRDAEGGVSLPQEIEIFPRFSLEHEKPVCDESNETYTVKIKVTNGKLPLKIDGEKADATVSETSNICFITAGPFKSGEPVTIKVGDSSNCTAQELTVTHTCIPLQPQPDKVNTPYNTPVTINVLENDIGSELKLTNAELKDPSQGTVVVNADQTITYTPDDAVENLDALINYTVIDSYGRSANETAIVHVGNKLCDLPCEGQYRRCAYRLWLQPPTGEGRYEAFKVVGNGIKFRFNDKEFKVDLLNANAILNAPPDKLNNNFHNAMREVIQRLSKYINKTLSEAFGPSGENRLELTYERSENDPFAVFWIEYFVCETFSLEFGFDYSMVGGQAFELAVRYTNEPLPEGSSFKGMILTNRKLDTVHRVPAFDCSERNQCKHTEYTPLCEGDKPQPTFEPPGDIPPYVFAGIVENMAPDKITGWVWDIPPDAKPEEPFYTGEKTEAKFKYLNVSIRLTVITDSGCYNVIEKPLLL